MRRWATSPIRRAAAALLLSALAAAVSANSYPVQDDVIGEIGLTASVREDTIADLSRAYGLGYREMRLANPDVDPWLAGEDTEIVIPSQYVLPNAPREGVVVNIPEMRLYHYAKPRGSVLGTVATYPISIGRQDWTTPHGVTRVVSRVKDPSWTPPESIRREHAAEGDILPRVVPAGPNNPLGAYAMRLGLPGYLIHGTDKPYGIGMRVTHGCIRMYPKDIETVYHTVPVGTPVRLVNEPYKIGFAHGRVYLEVHPPLEEDTVKFADEFSHVMGLVVARAGEREIRLNWAALRATLARRDGVPAIIGSATPKGLRTAAAGS